MPLMRPVAERQLLRRAILSLDSSATRSSHAISSSPRAISSAAASGATTSILVPSQHHHHYDTTRCFATGTCGARGHGWYQNYRAGKGGRHLQGEYYDHESLPEQVAWNEAVLSLGDTNAYMEVKVMPKTTTATSSSDDTSSSTATVEPLAVHTLTMRLASAVMPEATSNFIDLLTTSASAADTTTPQSLHSSLGYTNSLLYRMERNVGLCGGDVLTNTGRSGRPSSKALQNARETNPDCPQNFWNPLSLPILNDPLTLWHVPGTVSMLVSTVGEIDSRFLLTHAAAPHMNGIHRAIGMLTPESRSVVEELHNTILTRNGVPLNVNLVVGACGVVEGESSASTKESDSDTITQAAPMASASM